MGAFSRAFSAARDGVNARRAEGRRPSNDARFDKKTENSIDKHRLRGLALRRMFFVGDDVLLTRDAPAGLEYTIHFAFL